MCWLGFHFWPGNSQGKHRLEDLPVRWTGTKLGQCERETCHKSHGFRAGSSVGGGGPELSLHPAPRHCLLRLIIFPPTALKGWFPRPYATFPLHTVILRCRLGGQGHKECTESKQGLRWYWVKYWGVNTWEIVFPHFRPVFLSTFSRLSRTINTTLSFDGYLKHIQRITQTYSITVV